MNRSDRSFFSDKVVMITGASSGIGRASALIFAELNAKVVLVSRNEDKLNSLRDEIKIKSGHAVVIPADVSSFEDTQKVVHETISTWGRIDILIACAGKYVQGNTLDINIQLFEESMAINFYGQLNIIKSVLPDMRLRRKGHIVIVNSLDAKKGITGDAPYVAAKAALDGFGDVFRQEMRGSHIRVTSIYPGRVDTPMIQNIQVPWISPKIPPEKVARIIIKGIKRNKAIIVYPKVFLPIATLNTIMPRFMDWSYRILKIEGKNK